MKTLRSYIKCVLKEVKTSEFDSFESSFADVSTHDIYKGVYKGKNYYVKFPENEMQTLNEYLAYRIYSLYDVKIPESFDLVFNDQNKVGISSESFTGNIYKGRHASDDLRKKFGSSVGNMYYIDAFLANWDAAKNFVVDFDKYNEKGELDYRLIDPGGTLDFRAQGARKGKMFADEVGELNTFLDPNMTRGTGASYVYSGRDNKIAKDKFTSVTWERISSEISNVKDEVVIELKENNRHDLVKDFIDYCDNIKITLEKRHKFILNKT